MNHWFTAGAVQILHGQSQVLGRHILFDLSWRTPKHWADDENIDDPRTRVWALGAAYRPRGQRRDWSVYLRLLGLEAHVMRMPDKPQ